MGNRSDDPDGPPFFGVPQYNPYTVEGRIEQVGAMARGVKRARGAKKAWVLAVFALLLLVPWVIFLVAMIISD